MLRSDRILTVAIGTPKMRDSGNGGWVEQCLGVEA
jgi:hypothetical protein